MQMASRAIAKRFRVPKIETEFATGYAFATNLRRQREPLLCGKIIGNNQSNDSRVGGIVRAYSSACGVRQKSAEPFMHKLKSQFRRRHWKSAIQIRVFARSKIIFGCHALFFRWTF